MLRARLIAGVLTLAVVTTSWWAAAPAFAASAAELNRESSVELAKLYQKEPKAKELGAKAKGILVFPRIYKAGFLFGAQYGEGALWRGGKPVAYYNSVAASYGLQAGVQAFGYALLFMTDAALGYLNKSEGFELGVGPSIVVVDEGMARTMTTSTIQHDIYAFIFDQKGLMAGLGLQGSKLSRISK
jgi:lipid-binding SYLF domain-containing protein